MGRRIQRAGPAALAACALIFGAGCTVEFNINTGEAADEGGGVETAPEASTPPAAPEPPGAPDGEPPAPRSPSDGAPDERPPVLPLAESTDGPVRDALLRYPQPEPAPPPPADPEEPHFTPFTVAPGILNREEVVRALEAEWPPPLREAGIGGTARVYFFIDADGTVRNVRLDRSSGHADLDEAALRVARVYRFTPASNRGTPVPVWVSFPVTFQVR